MKYRIIGTLVILTVLGTLLFLYNGGGTDTPQVKSNTSDSQYNLK